MKINKNELKINPIQIIAYKKKKPTDQAFPYQNYSLPWN
jgi:hypothetical protein